jgi:hypothetical protein
MEKDAIDNQMALERHQRKHIKTAKTEQLESAKDDLFNDLDEVNEMDKKLLKQKEIQQTHSVKPNVAHSISEKTQED